MRYKAEKQEGHQALCMLNVCVLSYGERPPGMVVAYDCTTLLLFLLRF